MGIKKGDTVIFIVDYNRDKLYVAVVGLFGNSKGYVLTPDNSILRFGTSNLELVTKFPPGEYYIRQPIFRDGYDLFELIYINSN